MLGFWSKAVEIEFEGLTTRVPFDQLEVRRELLRQLNAIDGVSMPESPIGKRPPFPAEVLLHRDAMAAFSEVVRWFAGVVLDVPPTQAVRRRTAPAEDSGALLVSSSAKMGYMCWRGRGASG